MRALPTRALAAVMVVVFCAAFSPTVAAEEGPPASSDARVRTEGQTPDQASVAEPYLFRLAEKSRKRRRLAGGMGLGSGIFIAAAGAAMLSEKDEDDWLGLSKFFGGVCLVSGGAAALGGAAMLAIASPPEKAYKRVLSIQDPVMRERACADALASLAKKARTWRMIAGGLGCAAAAAGAVLAAKEDASGYTLMAVSAGAGALYSFLVKSPAERAYRAYLEQSPVKTIPDLILGFGPRGGIRVGLTMDF